MKVEQQEGPEENLTKFVEFNFYLLEIRVYACPVKIQPLEALSIIWAIPMTLAIQGGKIVTLAHKWDDDMTG